MADPLYGVVFPIQKAQITAWCWGACGHGQMGAIDLGLMHAIVCQKEDCPHLDKQMDEPMGDVDGRPLFMRKLKDITEGCARNE